MFESPHREEIVSFPYARLTVITGIFVSSRLAEMVYPDRANSFLAAFPAKKQLKGPSMFVQRDAQKRVRKILWVTLR